MKKVNPKLKSNSIPVEKISCNPVHDFENEHSYLEGPELHIRGSHPREGDYQKPPNACKIKDTVILR